MAFGFHLAVCGVVSLFAPIVAKVHLAVLCQRLAMCQALRSSKPSPQCPSARETWPLPRMFCSGHWSMTRQLTQDYVLVCSFGRKKEKRCIDTDVGSVVGNCDGLCTAGQREPIAMIQGGIAQSGLC